MNAALRAKTLVVEIAGWREMGRNLKSDFARVAEASGLSERRIRGIWNDEARKVSGDELADLERARQEAINNEIRMLRARLARLEEQAARRAETMGPRAGE
jgi:hypothetical protein